MKLRARKCSGRELCIIITKKSVQYIIQTTNIAFENDVLNAASSRLYIISADRAIRSTTLAISVRMFVVRKSITSIFMYILSKYIPNRLVILNNMSYYNMQHCYAQSNTC